MTREPDSATALLVELVSRGIRIKGHGAQLRYEPRSAMTLDLLARVKVHKFDLLEILQSAESQSQAELAQGDSADPYTLSEHRLLANVTEPMRAKVDAIKSIFDATVVAVRYDSTWARQLIAKLVRDARRTGDRTRARAIRDCWVERMAICSIDGGLSQEDAEGVAIAEVRGLPSDKG